MFHEKCKIYHFIPIQNEKVYDCRIPSVETVLAIVLLWNISIHNKCMIQFYHYVPSVLQYMFVPIYVLNASVIYYVQGHFFLVYMCML